MQQLPQQHSLAGQPTTLIILGGLPGTGKTTLARLLANRLGAMHLRIDTIEQALRNSRALAACVGDAGYRVAYAIAADNLRLGKSVVADSVNPLQITRDAWRAAAAGTGAQVIDVEVVCSDVSEHRRRVESRHSDIPGHSPPSWQEVIDREYHPWDRPHITVDTANSPADQVMATLWPMISHLE
jgi:predicted kinase